MDQQINRFLKCSGQYQFYFFAIIFSFLGFGIPPPSNAANELYDPDPPQDSAYVRIISLDLKKGPMDISIDDRLRIKKLNPNQLSDYLIVPIGKHKISFSQPGTSEYAFATTINTDRGNALTLAFNTLKAGTVPIVFEDKTNSNKLKALLVFYHLDPLIGPQDIYTSDGKTKVFSDVAPNSTASIQVNPISAELIDISPGKKTPQAKISLSLQSGNIYSILLTSDKAGKASLQIVKNQTERYIRN